MLKFAIMLLLYLLFYYTMELFILGIIGVGVLSMVVGFVWYSMQLFGKPWMKEVGLSMEDIGQGPGMGYLVTTVMSLVMAIVMNVFVVYTNTTTVVNGALLGLLAWVGFVAYAFGTNYIFEKRSLKLFLIDSGYFLVVLVAAGAIMGYFN